MKEKKDGTENGWGIGTGKMTMLTAIVMLLISTITCAALYAASSSQSQVNRQNAAKIKPPGIRNLGNSCYMNAMLQALHLTHGFKDWLIYYQMSDEDQADANSFKPDPDLDQYLENLLHKSNENPDLYEQESWNEKAKKVEEACGSEKSEAWKAKSQKSVETKHQFASQLEAEREASRNKAILLRLAQVMRDLDDLAQFGNGSIDGAAANLKAILPGSFCGTTQESSDHLYLMLMERIWKVIAPKQTGEEERVKCQCSAYA